MKLREAGMAIMIALGCVSVPRCEIRPWAQQGDQFLCQSYMEKCVKTKTLDECRHQFHKDADGSWLSYDYGFKV